MARSTDRRFYTSTRWRKERDNYRKAHPFCERCLLHGIYKPTEIVHHIEHLTTEKALDASIALNSDNLEALCLDCHNKEHTTGKIRRKSRWRFENGELILSEIPPVEN